MVGSDRWKSCQDWCQWDYEGFYSSRKDQNVDGVVQEIQDLFLLDGLSRKDYEDLVYVSWTFVVPFQWDLYTFFDWNSTILSYTQ